MLWCLYLNSNSLALQSCRLFVYLIFFLRFCCCWKTNNRVGVSKAQHYKLCTNICIRSHSRMSCKWRKIKKCDSFWYCKVEDAVHPLSNSIKIQHTKKPQLSGSLVTHTFSLAHSFAFTSIENLYSCVIQFSVACVNIDSAQHRTTLDRTMAILCIYITSNASMYSVDEKPHFTLERIQCVLFDTIRYDSTVLLFANERVIASKERTHISNQKWYSSNSTHIWQVIILTHTDFRRMRWQQQCGKRKETTTTITTTMSMLTTTIAIVWIINEHETNWHK